MAKDTSPFLFFTKVTSVSSTVRCLIVLRCLIQSIRSIDWSDSEDGDEGVETGTLKTIG